MADFENELEENETKKIEEFESLDFSKIKVTTKEGKEILQLFDSKFDYLLRIIKSFASQMSLTYTIVQDIRTEFNELKKYNSQDVMQELEVKYEVLKTDIKHELENIKNRSCPEIVVNRCKEHFSKKSKIKDWIKSNAKAIWAIALAIAVTSLVHYIIDSFK